MNIDRILDILREHAPELKADGLLHLQLFGSVARGQACAISDIDLIGEFDRTVPLTLVHLGSLQTRLTHLLGAPVDLASTEWMRSSIREQATQEAVVVF